MASSLDKFDMMPIVDENAAQVEYSIIIPVYNEVQNIEPLYAAIKPVIEKIDRSCEVIFIDDGSKDGTYDALRKIHENDPVCRIIRFRRNFGQTAAMAAGFTHARGNVIITLDGDLQNDPTDIPMLLDKVAEGYDVVSGWRVNRKDKFITRRVPSICANWLISKITGVNLHDYGCTLKAYRREVAQNVGLYGEMHRFIPAIASWMGVNVAEVPVKHHARQHGRSKYGLSRTMRVVLDLITVKFLLSYATRPLQVFGSIGFISASLGFALGLYLTFCKLLLGYQLSSRPMLFLSILLILVGIQLITMGLLGEMLVRIYHEGQNKPVYAIREILE